MRSASAILYSLSILLGALTMAGASGVSDTYLSMMKKLQSLATYQTTVTGTMQAQQGKGSTDQGESVTFVEHIVYKRPNQLVVSIPDFLGGITIWSDGKNLFQYYGMSNKYKESPVPSDMIREITSTSTAAGLKPAGNGKVDGVPVNILKGPGFQPGSMLTMWIGRDDHLPYKIETVQPKVSDSTYTTVLTQTFRKTTVNQQIADTVFQLHPPSSALKAADSEQVPGGIGFAIPGAGK